MDCSLPFYSFGALITPSPIILVSQVYWLISAGLPASPQADRVPLVKDFETVGVLIRFDSYKGVWVRHCRKPEHEENGMMMNIEVQ